LIGEERKAGVRKAIEDDVQPMMTVVPIGGNPIVANQSDGNFHPGFPTEIQALFSAIRYLAQADFMRQANNRLKLTAGSGIRSPQFVFLAVARRSSA
jgi:hypothetical protein